MTGDEQDLVGELCAPVRAAVDAAGAKVEALLRELIDERSNAGGSEP